MSRKAVLWWKNRKIPTLTVESFTFGILMAIIGGFLDAYTYVSRGGVFANAQTGNIVLLGVEIAHGNVKRAYTHIPPIFAFVLGAAVTEFFKHWHRKSIFQTPGKVVLFLEMVLLSFVGMLPPEFPNNVVTIVVAFVASIQFSTFRKLSNQAYTTTVATGNLRTATIAAFIAIFFNDRQAVLESLRFFSILISFFLGALAGTLFTISFSTKSIWITVGILVIIICLFSDAKYS